MLVVGEALVDIVHRQDGSTETFPGGSAANVAVALARLGRDTGFVTSFADDEHGRLIADHLAESGVRLETDPHVVPRTSSALATLQADGSARYTFDIDWRIGPVEVTDPPLAVHACSLGAVLTPGCDDVRALMARLRGASTTSYDVNMRPSVTGVGPAIAKTVEETVALSDIVKASDEDLEALYPGESEADAAERLLALGPAAVVVTRGADGAAGTPTACAVAAPGVAVTVADTIGAGDTFGAAMLDELGSRGLLGGGVDAIRVDDPRAGRGRARLRHPRRRRHRVAARRRPAVPARALVPGRSSSLKRPGRCRLRGGLGDQLAVGGVEWSGAGVVDQEVAPVRGAPDVAAVAALPAGVAGVGLPAMMSAAEGRGVVGAGLARWAVRLEGLGMVEVGAEALAAGVGEAVAAGDQADPLLEVGGVLVAGEPDAVGEVLDRA